MKLSEATIILEDLQTTSPQVCPEKRRLAVQLGIEALKRLYEHRNEYYFEYDLPLPGETEKTPSDTSFKHSTANHRRKGSN